MRCYNEEDYSDWHDTDKFVPGQVGVYQFESPRMNYYCFRYWDGKQWISNGWTPNAAALQTVPAPLFKLEGTRFRGLRF